MVATEHKTAIEPSAAHGMRFLIVEARFYDAIADELLAGAEAALEAAGAEHDTITVPGALEIPAAIAMAVEGEEHYDGYVALGCVIRGETTHYEIVSGESARGLMDLSLEGIAIGNGILTVENEGQALARARRSEMDKGGGAANAAIAMALLRHKLGA
jgi:6,7-dimethyl-8-ribityllumazine synthase